MRHGDDFYKKLADIQNAKSAMRSGNHSHFCPRCKAHKYCPQLTHCRRPDEALCLDCAEPLSFEQEEKEFPWVPWEIK